MTCIHKGCKNPIHIKKRSLCAWHYEILLKSGKYERLIRKKGEGTFLHGHKLITVNGDQVYEHRYLMEQFLKRPLEKWEIIHHINGDRIDNRIENLIVTTRPEHMKIHWNESEERRTQWLEAIKPFRNKRPTPIPRPKPTFEGQEWRNNYVKKPRTYFVKSCGSCHKFIWIRKSHISKDCRSCSIKKAWKFNSKLRKHLSSL